MITKESIENLKNHIDVVDVVSQFIELKKSGANFKACCPFHGETTPSFVVSPAKQIYHCFGCLAPKEEIRTKDGIKEIQNIEVGDYVYSSNGKETKVIETLSHKPQYGMLKFKTDLFDEWSYFTQNHDMLVLTQDDVKKNLPYIRVEKNRPLKFYGRIKKNKKEINIKTQVLFAKEVKKGDYFLYPIDREVITKKAFDFSDFWEKSKFGPSVDIIKKVKITKDLMWLFGMYIAEGSTYKGGIKFSLHSKEINYAKKIIEILKKSFKKEASLFYPKNRKNSLEVTCSSSNLEYIFKKLFASGAENKEYPYYFNYLKKSFKSSLFDGLMDADGCYSRRTYKTISKKLSYLLFDLAISLELIPSLYKGKEYKDKKNVNHKKCYTILFQKRESLKAFFENINDVKYLCMRVKSIKESEDEELVYDITVEDKSHTFLTKNFIVGNCGVGGDSIKFVMEYEKLSYPETLEKLASMHNVTLEYDNNNNQKKQDIKVLEEVNKYYQKLFINNNIAKEYIYSRGISEFSIEKFEIGYAPSSNDTINFLKNNYYNLADAKELGIIDTGQNGLYSRFIERITFPIHSINGKIVGFGGRTITGHNAKYVNSPQTKIFNKSKLLYGYSQAKENIYKRNRIIVTEGYLDVIMLHQAGFNTAVATLGTALTQDHLPLLRRGEPKVILAYDGDKAGLNAAFKASVMLSQGEFEGGVVIFGEGKDPADMVHDGRVEELNEIFASPQVFISFAIDYIIEKYDINDPSQKQKALIETNDYLKSLGMIYQDEYKRYIAQRLNIRENLVKVSTDVVRKNEVNLTKIDIGELCIIRSILEKPQRLDSVLDIIDSTMFEHHRNEFELLITDINNQSFNGILLNDKLEVYDDERLKQELLVLLLKFYANKLRSVQYNTNLPFKEKANLLRKIKDNIYQLKLGKLVSYNL